MFDPWLVPATSSCSSNYPQTPPSRGLLPTENPTLQRSVRYRHKISHLRRASLAFLPVAANPQTIENCSATRPGLASFWQRQARAARGCSNIQRPGTASAGQYGLSASAK
jgi:hypothetical protein